MLMRDFSNIDGLVDGFVKYADRYATAPLVKTPVRKKTKLVNPSSVKPPEDLVSAYKSVEARTPWVDKEQDPVNGKSYKQWVDSLPEADKSVVQRYRDWSKDTTKKISDRNQATSDAEMAAKGIVQTSGTGHFLPDVLKYSAKNLASAPARTAQIVTKGLTDVPAGIFDLVGARDWANGVRSFQRGIDDGLSKNFMSNEMAQAYLDDKFGRGAGDVASWAISVLAAGGALGAVGKLGNLKHLQAAKSGISSVLGKPFSIYRPIAKSIPGARKLYNGVKGVSGAVSALAGKVAPFVPYLRSNAIENRVTDVDEFNDIQNYPEGDVNRVRKYMDKLNNEWGRQRARMDMQYDRDMNAKRLDAYGQLYRPDEFYADNPVPLMYEGRPVMEKYVDDANTIKSRPVLARNPLHAENLEKNMIDQTRAEASHSHGPLATSYLGRVMGNEQPSYTVPAILGDRDIEPDGRAVVPRLPDIKARPDFTDDGDYVMDVPYWNEGANRTAQFAWGLPGVNMLPIGSRLIDSMHQGDYGSAVGSASGLALGALGARIPTAGGSLAGNIAGSFLPSYIAPAAVDKAAPLAAKYSRISRIRALLQELDEQNKYRNGYVTPGFHTYLKDELDFRP